MQALETELEGAQIQVDENKEHTRVLAEHLDNVRLEISHTQARLAARRREVETEAHLQEVAARETGRLRADIARLQQRRGELEQSATAMQTEAFQAGERMDQFKLVQNWNQARGARIPAVRSWIRTCTARSCCLWGWMPARPACGAATLPGSFLASSARRKSWSSGWQLRHRRRRTTWRWSGTAGRTRRG